MTPRINTDDYIRPARRHFAAGPTHKKKGTSDGNEFPPHPPNPNRPRDG